MSKQTKKKASNPTGAAQPVTKRFPAEEKLEVVLTCHAPEAQQVQVAGTFNDWRPEATPLAPAGSGDWAARLSLRSGQYQYRFVVDGRWTDDAEASRSVPNPYGGTNAVLTVGLDDRTDFL